MILHAKKSDFSKIEFLDKKIRFETVCFLFKKLYVKNCEYFWNFSETLLKNCDECEDQIFPPILVMLGIIMKVN